MDIERKYGEKIIVKNESRFFFLNTKDIRYISAYDNYLKLHFAKKVYLIRETMSGIEEILDPSTFIRIHRSIIVNINYVTEVLPRSHGDYFALLKDGTRLNLSRNFSSRLLNRNGNGLLKCY